MGRVQDRVEIVTGGAGGIGAAACRAIAAEGAKVLVADLDPDAARAVKDEILASGGSAESIGVDVTDRALVQAMVRKAVDAFGELNVIFNNAGINRPRHFMEVDEANFEETMRVNTWGVIVCTQEAREEMIAQGSGGQDRQHRINREPPGLLGLRPVPLCEVRRARDHPGDRPRPHRARDHRAFSWSPRSIVVVTCRPPPNTRPAP